MKTDHTPAVATKPAAKPKRPARTMVPTGPQLSDSEREKIMQGAHERRAKIDLTVPATAPATPPVSKAKAAVTPPLVEVVDVLPAGAWDQADPDGKPIPFLLRLPPPLHAKMTFLSAHLVPHKAKHPLALAILSAQFDLLIRQYYAAALNKK